VADSTRTPITDEALPASTSGQVLTSTGPTGKPAFASTVSAVAVQDKGGAVWHAKSFGAVGDGVADDTTKIDAAITAASAAGGGVVKLPPGTFYTKGHQLPSNVHLEGSGHSYTKLLIRGDTNLSAGIQLVGVDHASVRDLTVDARTNSPQCNGIAVMATTNDGTGTPCTNCTIEGCQVLGWDNHQYIIFSQLGQHIKIIGNWVDGGITVRNPASGQEGIEVQGGFDVLVEGNTVTNAGDSGIHVLSVESSVMSTDDVRVIGNSVNGCNRGLNIAAQVGLDGANPLSRIKVIGNIFQNCLQKGVHLWTTGGAPIKDVDISHNTFDGIGALTEPGVYGIFAAGDSTWPANPSLCRDIRITDNLIRNVIGSGTSVGANFANWPGLIFARNTVKDITSGTVGGIVAGNAPDLQILQNTVDNSNTAGIDIQAGCHRVIVAGNEVRNWNVLTGSNGGILIAGVSYGQVIGNAFYQGTPANDYFPMAPNSSCDHLTVAGNVALYSTTRDMNLTAGTSPSGNAAAGTQIFWDRTNNRLGVNNSAPTKPLDVTGDAKVSGTLTAGTLSAASGTITGTLTANLLTAPGGTLSGQQISAIGSNAQVEINSQDGLGGEFVLYSPTGSSLRVYCGGDKFTLSSAGDLTLTGNVIAGAGKALKVGSNSITWGTAAPSSGTWVAGDICWNTAVASGQPEGWRCTTGGTSGTWSAMANHP
jgi:hypothetical protein